MFKSVGKMDILHFVLSLIHCRFTGLNSPNGNSDNFFAMRYQWQQNKAEGDWETDWSLQSRASMRLQKVRNCYDDKRRRDQKLMRLWRGFWHISMSRCKFIKGDSTVVKGINVFGDQKTWIQTLALAVSSFMYLHKLLQYSLNLQLSLLWLFYYYVAIFIHILDHQREKRGKKWIKKFGASDTKQRAFS